MDGDANGCGRPFPHHTSAASADTAMMTFTALISMIAVARV